MDRYSRRNLEDLVVPNYQETSDSYPSPDMWGTGWSMNSSEAAEKCFDYDVIHNGFSGGLYSQMQMEMGTSEQVEEETKRLKASGCFDRSLHDFDEIQQMDDMFLYSPTHSLSLSLYIAHKRFYSFPMFIFCVSLSLFCFPVLTEEVPFWRMFQGMRIFFLSRSRILTTAPVLPLRISTLPMAEKSLCSITTGKLVKTCHLW